MKKIPISHLAGVTVTMNYIHPLCIPSIQALYEEEFVVIDYSGEIRKISEGFPKEKAERLSKWAKCHGEKIIMNHHLTNSGERPIYITPLDK